MTNDTASPTVPDTIERELTLTHPVERVWQALTDPTELARWFGDSARIDLHPGGEGMFTWGDDHSAAVVEVVEPPRRFAFWWTSGIGDTVTPENRTLVDFTLDAVEGGTRLRMVESGFAMLADGARQRSGNVEGWTIELGDLAAHLDAA